MDTMLTPTKTFASVAVSFPGCNEATKDKPAVLHTRLECLLLVHRLLRGSIVPRDKLHLAHELQQALWDAGVSE